MDSLLHGSAHFSPHIWIWTRPQRTAQCRGGCGPCQPPWPTSPCPPCPTWPTCQGLEGRRDRCPRIPLVCQSSHLSSLPLLLWGPKTPWLPCPIIGKRSGRMGNGGKETDAPDHKDIQRCDRKTIDIDSIHLDPTDTRQLICNSCHKYNKLFVFQCQNVYHLNKNLQDQVYSSEITFNTWRQNWSNSVWSIRPRYFQQEGINIKWEMDQRLSDSTWVLFGGIRRGLWAQTCFFPVHLKF